MGSEKLISSFLLLHVIIILFLKPPMKNFNLSLSLYNTIIFKNMCSKCQKAVLQVCAHVCKNTCDLFDLEKNKDH